MHTVTISAHTWEYSQDSHPLYLATLHSVCKARKLYITCHKIEAMYDKMDERKKKQMVQRGFAKVNVDVVGLYSIN